MNVYIMNNAAAIASRRNQKWKKHFLIGLIDEFEYILGILQFIILTSGFIHLTVNAIAIYKYLNSGVLQLLSFQLKNCY